MSYETLLSEGYQVLKGCTRDGSQIFRKIINLPNGSTKKLYAKVQHRQVIGNIEKNIMNLGDDTHHVRTTFTKTNGEELKSYTHITRKVDNGYTFTYGHSYHNTENVPKSVYEELSFGSNGTIYDARRATNYGDYEHIIHTDNYKGNAHRWLEIFDRKNPYNNVNSVNNEWLDLSTNFSSISNARKQGWFG